MDINGAVSVDDRYAHLHSSLDVWYLGSTVYAVVDDQAAEPNTLMLS